MNKKSASKVATHKKAKSADEGAAHCVMCSETLDITQAAAMYTQLREALATRQPVTLDATAVQLADTAVLQVMCAFISAARAANIAVTWRQPSAAFCRAAGLLNLHDCLGLQVAR